MDKPELGLIQRIKMVYNYYLDKTMKYTFQRWIVWVLAIFLYGYRIYSCQGFYLITYALGLYILNLFIGFVSPLEDPDFDTDGEDLLPTKESDEFKPFIRRVPEFTFWYESLKSILSCLIMTLNRAFDVPVFWPILVAYFIVYTLQRTTYSLSLYVPWTTGKASYAHKK